MVAGCLCVKPGFENTGAHQPPDVAHVFPVTRTCQCPLRDAARGIQIYFTLRAPPGRATEPLLRPLLWRSASARGLIAAW